MGTAIFSGVSALQSQQEALNVIGNNIANLNTTGFRGSRVVFSDLLSQTLTGASPPQGNRGGINPRQVGLGVSVASIDIDLSQGSLLNTGGVTDFAIQGDGFFILAEGASTYYTRDGSFGLDSDGTLVDPATGIAVQGYVAVDGVIDTSQLISDIVIPVGGAAVARATSTATMGGQLNSQVLTVGDSTDPLTIYVFDSLGTEQTLTLTFTHASVVPGGGGTYTWSLDHPDLGAPLTGTITFDADGQVTAGGAPTISIPLTNGATSPFDFVLDMSSLTYFDIPAPEATPLVYPVSSSLLLTGQDGLQAGVLESFTISQGGVITGVFSNGLSEVLGQVALAVFNNAGGLVSIGSNMYIASANSGIAQVGISGTGGRGSVSGGVLEGSNVDIATEFSNLILAQRAFQAGARSITTADSILAEAVNLIR